jgi:hypothetical protein
MKHAAHTFVSGLGTGLEATLANSHDLAHGIMYHDHGIAEIRSAWTLSFAWSDPLRLYHVTGRSFHPQSTILCIASHFNPSGHPDTRLRQQSIRRGRVWISMHAVVWRPKHCTLEEESFRDGEFQPFGSHPAC